jgi:hypothetical protein
MLIAAGAPSMASADGGATTRIEATGLVYGEKDRTDVFEPSVRVTRLFPNGQSLSAAAELDAMTGASPTGAMPSGRIETSTSASGTVTTLPVGQLPTASFKDLRGAFDLDWQATLGPLTTTTSGHASREKDYSSLGLSGQVAVDLISHLTTLTFGAGVNRDRVFPVISTASSGEAGARPGPETAWSSRGVTTAADDPISGPNFPKRVTSGLVGVSQVLTRRWLVSLNVSRSVERGYLTEPYKVVSLIDSDGNPSGEIAESRPDFRRRTDVLAGSVYQLGDDVVHLSYRYYWDDWNVRSHTYDLKYRHDLDPRQYVQPHVRYYAQSPADFFRYGLIHGPPFPEFVSSDSRLGPLRSATVGMTYGFPVSSYPGEFSVRVEYMRQWGDGHPSDAVGAERQLDLFPAVNVGSVLIGYSVEF